MMTPEWIGIAPLWIVGAGALALLVWEALTGARGRYATPAMALLFLLSALATDLWLYSTMASFPDGAGARTLFHGDIQVDLFSLVIQATGILSAVVAVLFSAPYLKNERAVTGEYYSLLLFAVAGIVALAGAAELLTLFVALELLSLPAYVLAGYMRVRERAVEASLKYFLQGVFASAFLLYGIALIYGATGSTSIAMAMEYAQKSVAPGPLFTLGAVFLFVGFGFKVAIVPFHAWAPDVYDGSALPVGAFLSTGIKTAGFAALVRLLPILFAEGSYFTTTVAVLSAATMLLGNLGAFAQRSVKRMLAYSSVAHVGYILIALVPFHPASAGEQRFAVSYYMLAYTFMTAGAFGFLSWMAGKEEGGTDLEAFAGLGLRRPLPALAMALFLFSLAGFPPTAGFFAKYYVFRLAVTNGYVWLAILGVLNSFLSAYYYLRVVVQLYMKPAPVEGIMPFVERGSPHTLTVPSTIPVSHSSAGTTLALDYRAGIALALCGAGVLFAGILAFTV